MSQSNVFTSVSSQSWNTDKARISTGATAVTFQVEILYPTEAGNLYSAPVAVPGYSMRDVFVGVGNKLTVIGSDFTAQEIGTTTSGIRAVRQA